MKTSMKVSSWRLNEVEIAHITHALEQLAASNVLPKTLFGLKTLSQAEIIALKDRFQNSLATQSDQQ